MRKVDADLMSRLNIRTALDAEASSARRDLLPLKIGDLTALGSLAEVEAIIATRAQQGKVGIEPAPVLSASKWRHGRRPAAALALPERVLYRATAQLLADGLAGIWQITIPQIRSTDWRMCCFRELANGR